MLYLIRNSVNGKKYVGRTIHPKTRWATHRRKLRRGTHENAHLQAAWNKYGSRAFSFEIIETHAAADLPEMEQRWLDKMDDSFYNQSHSSFSNVQRGQDAPQALLTDAQVEQMKIALSDGVPVRQVAIYFSCHIQTVYAIRSGRQWSHIRPDLTMPQGYAKGEARPEAKLTESDVRTIRTLLETMSQRSVAEKYGVSRSSIQDIKEGKTWQHVI